MFHLWEKRDPNHFLAVVRHEERADALDDTLVDGKHWCRTQDMLDWQLDPPLSDRGMDRANALGQRLKELSQEVDSTIHIVLSSPYHRCMQTAAAICKVLGPNTRLLVDLSIGEVYGPCVLGDEEPRPPFVRFQRAEQRHVKTVGSWPTWPESLQAARLRYANRFLKYLQRSVVARRNFVMVTHGDCVGAALSVMPCFGSIQSIGFGSMFVAQRLQEHSLSWLSSEGRIEEGLDDKGTVTPDLTEASVWQVQVHGIEIKSKGQKAFAKESVEERVQGLQAVPFSKNNGIMRVLIPNAANQTEAVDPAEMSLSEKDSIWRFGNSTSFSRSSSDDADTPAPTLNGNPKAAQAVKRAGQKFTLQLLEFIEMNNVEVKLSGVSDKAPSMSVKAHEHPARASEKPFSLSGSGLMKRRASKEVNTKVSL